ncbi:ABC transporter permease [Nocardioides aromaticivorans]|uniref:ABC transporter permease n=1 Tax=Nocardioides aromaticivorans TaxID=200618 RepID=A0ABX7PND6_9ACTN|nr:ABC transporter permease [Nocardioides aromaticivorans]QSR27455.1 ABC transporter permease [Nocardioides aromaticivorans]
MTATTVETGTGRGAGQVAPTRAVPAATPFRRVLHVELRKMFDTRSGLWLMVGVAALSVIATVAVILFAPDDQITYESFATAIGLPLSVILPMIAILGITSEWSQRSGLTTFTLVPSRGRVIGAKAAATLLVGVVSMVVAFAVGALGNLAGSAVAGVDTVWNVSLGAVPQIVLGNLVGMAVGFALGVVLRSSPAAIVGYFVVSFVMPGILVLLAEVREWFADLQPWVDWNTSQVTLFDGATDTAREWAMLGTTSAIWIVLPLVVGGLFLRRSEVK